MLEMAILCGQDRLAQWLASLGLDAGSMTSADLHAGLDFSWGWDWLKPYSFNSGIEPIETAKFVYRTCRAKYNVVILQWARWWRHACTGQGGRNAISVLHAKLIEHIAGFAFPLRPLPEFAPPRAQRAQDARPPDNGEEALPELIVEEPWIDPVTELEPAAEIDPAEAAAVAEERWASGVEALCANQIGFGVTGEVEVVVLTFGRDGQDLDDAVTSSRPARRALSSGADLKPAWANGAKVLVPGMGPGVAAEARVHLEPRHVVVFACDVAEVLDALTSLPSRGRPRLKPVGAFASVPAAGDVSLFADASGSGGSSSTGFARDLKSGSSFAASTRTLDARGGMSLDQLPVGVALRVRWTFLHVEDDSPTDAPQSSRSA